MTLQINRREWGFFIFEKRGVGGESEKPEIKILIPCFGDNKKKIQTFILGKLCGAF